MNLGFFAHIPGIRIWQECVDVADGELWQMPFEAFHSLGVGSQMAKEYLYDEAAPVFLHAAVRARDASSAPAGSPGQILEFKHPTSELCNNWDKIGLTDFRTFHETVVKPFWDSVLLAAPAACAAPPMASLSFIRAEDEPFMFHGRSIRTLAFRGDVDLEYCFAPDFASEPLDEEVFRQAEALRAHDLGTIQWSPALRAALAVLEETAQPSLSEAEVLTLSVVALESLLLPDVRAGMRQKLATRLANLLGRDEAERQSMYVAARRLYDERSGHLHGIQPRGSTDSSDEADYVKSQRLLAGAIQCLIPSVRSGVPIDQIRVRLDDGPFASGMAPSQMWRTIRQPAPARLEQREPFVSATFDVSTTRTPRRLVPWRRATEPRKAINVEAPEGKTVGWAPLIGLECSVTYSSGTVPEIVLGPAAPSHLINLEDLSTRTDMIESMGYEDDRTIAFLGVGAPTASDIDAQHLHLAALRDLAVVALRLSMGASFVDPSFMGDFWFVGRTRMRRPTVYRQTGWLDLDPDEPPTDVITSARKAQVADSISLILQYEARGREGSIDHVLSLYRRGMEPKFVEQRTSAGLLFGTLEACLGRFGDTKRSYDLSDLVAVIAPPGLAAWFKDFGKTIRDDVAHGRWGLSRDTEKALGSLQQVASIVVSEIVKVWIVPRTNNGVRPRDLLIRKLETQLS